MIALWTVFSIFFSICICCYLDQLALLPFVRCFKCSVSYNRKSTAVPGLKELTELTITSTTNCMAAITYFLLNRVYIYILALSSMCISECNFGRSYAFIVLSSRKIITQNEVFAEIKKILHTLMAKQFALIISTMLNSIAFLISHPIKNRCVEYYRFCQHKQIIAAKQSCRLTFIPGNNKSIIIRRVSHICDQKLCFEIYWCFVWSAHDFNYGRMTSNRFCHKHAC